jgi:dihydrofolate reductase
MIVSIIVAAASDHAIGKDNGLLWHLPNDLKFFKNTTWGMPVVMGRKTYSSLAGEPLPGRINIVVTRQPGFDPGDSSVVVVQTIEQAIENAAETNCLEVFIAGGGEIYRQVMDRTDRIYLTRVHAKFPDAQVFFEGFNEKEWTLKSKLDFPADEKHAYAYSFEVWER